MPKKPTEGTFEPENALVAAATPRPPISRKDALSNLRKAVAIQPDTEVMWKAMRDFDLQRQNIQHDDRACALVLGAFLEQALEHAILTHCIDLTDDEKRRLFGAPSEAAMSFDIKIRLGFALGIYGPISRCDLATIRQIRNAFAHAKTNLRFSSTDVADACNHLKYIDITWWGGLFGPKPTSARKKFIETTLHYFAWLAVDRGKPIRYAGYELSRLYS